jgi:alkanesulfonate monooxygenase SsuD/methylene tetrahydromethanopterin reductase-like flavin-dependent oxidoreductase (luciferase family)
MTCEGASIPELGPFSHNMETKREVGEDGVGAVMPMSKDGGFEYDGPSFKMPRRNVLPRPIQAPHPLLWVGFLLAAMGAGMVLYFKPAS